MGHEFIHLICKTGDRGSFLLLFHIIVTWFCLIEHTVHKSPSDLSIRSDNPKNMIIQVYTRTFPSSSSPPLYVNPSYFHPYFSLQTAEQFTERLDRMLSTPDISLITSQGTPRPPWPKMLSGLWLLPSAVYLSSMYEEEEVLRFSMHREHRL